MKPKNFPARKLARQIAADSRLGLARSGTTARAVLLLSPEAEVLDAARDTRTKKRRAGA